MVSVLSVAIIIIMRIFMMILIPMMLLLLIGAVINGDDNIVDFNRGEDFSLFLFIN